MTRRKDVTWWIFVLALAVAWLASGRVWAGATVQAGDDSGRAGAVRADDGADDAVAQPPTLPFQAADTILMIFCCALTLPMIPALGHFYGGMARRKNVLSAFQQTFILLGVIALQWLLFGYSLAFDGNTLGGFCGGWQWFGLGGVGIEPNRAVAPGIPQELFMLFQMLVAVFAAALISGAIVERVKFSSYLLFTVLWSTLVYDPVAHWVWAPDGWIKKLGALDFAGGLVVHLTSGLAALCCVRVVGKRRGLDHEDLHPHNLTLTALGTGLLWFGWQGLNAGAARGANAAAVAAFVSTNLAGAAAIVSWSLIEYLLKRRVTVLGACTGAIAGLVAVSPAAGYVSPLGAFAIGFMVAPLCYFAIALKGKLGYDDSLDVFGVHGVGGLCGVLMLGFVAAPFLTGGSGGLLAGNVELLAAQVIATGAVALYTVVVTTLLLVAIDRLIGLRVTAEEEDLGLDLTQHGQRGYLMGEGELIGIEA
jgi:Amt family ammonium transporter